MTTLPVVGVMGSGEHGHEELAAPLGEWLARRRVHLLTGGGGGVMAAVARAFCSVPDRAGLSIGILPTASERDRGTPAPGYPNPWVELAVRTHLPHSGARGTEPTSRNHINILTSTVVVALPGSTGTASEISLALAYDTPVIAYHAEKPIEVPHGVTSTTHFAEVTRFVERYLH